MKSASNPSDELRQLRERLEALEMQHKQKSRAPANRVQTPPSNNNMPNERYASRRDDSGGDASSTEAVMNPMENVEDGSDPRQSSASQQPNGSNGKSVGWLDTSDHATQQNTQTADPPMKSVKFRGPQSVQEEGQVEEDEESASSSSSSSSDPISFQGWARVFFQARHHRSATQVVTTANSTTSQDTYLHLSINSTANELRISNTEDRSKPPLIDPPIQLKYFYALKVPGSNSGAALFLKNDDRRLRKYIFRFEFINRAVHQPPQRYLQFIRSGNAAKKSMRGIKMRNMQYTVVGKMGASEERKENLRENTKKAQDAFAAHLATLDDLLRESSEMADRFVECVNSRGEDEEMNRNGGGVGAGLGLDGAAAAAGRVKRTRPPPPYWGSGYNRPNTNQENGDDDDEDVETDSDYSDEEDELYDDDDDDETFFDKVQVSTEQTLETLFRHIVK